jgi:hypothetical protein
MWMQGSGKRLLEALLERLLGVFGSMAVQLHPKQKSNNLGSFCTHWDFVKIVTKLSFARPDTRRRFSSCRVPISMFKDLLELISSGGKSAHFSSFQPMGG